MNYEQGHFSLRAPGGFGAGGEFDKFWLAAATPRMIYVTLQHPSPYYDDSYGVNSENNGPFGDAIMQELIPAVEEQVPGHPRAVGAHALRRIDRRLDCRRAPGLLPRLLRPRVRQLPRLGGLPLSPDRRHLQGRQRLLHRQGLDEGRASEPAAARRQHPVDDEGREPLRARRRRQVTLGRPVGHLGGDLLAGRRRRLSRSGSGTRRPDRSTRRSPSRGASSTCATSSKPTGARSGRRSRTS